MPTISMFYGVIDCFRRVRVFLGGVGWPDGQELGPDTLAADPEP